MANIAIFQKGRKLDFEAVGAARASGKLSLPRIPTSGGSQSARGPRRDSLEPQLADVHPPSGSQTVRAVRKDGLDKLEEAWRNRKIPKGRSSRASRTHETESAGDENAAMDVRIRSGASEGSKPPSREGISAPSSRGTVGLETIASAREDGSGASSSQDLEQVAEMAELRALMAANDVEAAEAKLQQIIEAAEEDGHIDEEEQHQIDEASLELAAIRQRQEQEKKAFEVAAVKAAEQAALQALLVSNDVVAAERKLREIIAAAEEDGHIDEEEQRQIDEAKRELEKLQSRKALLEGKARRIAARGGGDGVADRLRAEKMAFSIAAKETAAERLRLATALRELKEKHAKLRADFARLQEEKRARDDECAAAHAEVAALQAACAELRQTVARQAGEADALREERAQLQAELGKANRLAAGRLEQLKELGSAFEQAKLRWEKDYDVLAVKEQRAAALAAELQQQAAGLRERAAALERDNRQLGESARLERQSAQLEKAAADKYRVRCVELEEKWAAAEARADALVAERRRAEEELRETAHALAEAEMWHKSRVLGRPTARRLLLLPPEAQEVALAGAGLEDHDAVVAAEFLIDNVMMVSCDLGGNNIGRLGATALAQALVGNLVLASLSLRDNAIGPAGATRLAEAVRGSRTLEKLNLMGCAVGDAGAVALLEAAAAPQCGLRALALRHNDITDVGAAAAAAAIRADPALTELGLNGNRITDEGIAAIAVALGCNSRLTLLRLTENPYGRESLKRLTNSKREGLHLYF